MATGIKPLFISPSPTACSTPNTPKTPADEGIEFFQAEVHSGESLIPVYELKLDPDGGPSKELSVCLYPYANPISMLSDRAFSIFDFRQHTYHTSCAFLWKQGPLLQRMAFSKQISRSMVDLSDATNIHRESAYSLILRPARPFDQCSRLPQDFSKPVQLDLPISQAGAFVYWIEYDSGNGKRVTGRSGYFNIDPILKIKARTPILDETLRVLSPINGGSIKDELVNLPLDGLSVLTVVSKWMGSLESWAKHFAEAKDRGYTMLHYTPLQERGESNSPFSIRNQMNYDSSLFGTNLSDEEGKKRMGSILKIAREEYGLLGLTDVVLNHTANDSPWLIEHPEAGECV
jgi:glycogen debranching enzyme